LPAAGSWRSALERSSACCPSLHRRLDTEPEKAQHGFDQDDVADAERRRDDRLAHNIGLDVPQQNIRHRCVEASRRADKVVASGDDSRVAPIDVWRAR
jgi:hypothetical protein